MAARYTYRGRRSPRAQLINQPRPSPRLDLDLRPLPANLSDMAVFTEIHNGDKYARVHVPSASGAMGTTHLAPWYGWRHGVTLCGLGVFHTLLPLPSTWSGEPPNQCRSCNKNVAGR